MTKKLPLEIKLTRKATRVACEFCHSKHLQCDDSRPCLNCSKRGIQHSCKDSVRKRKSGYKKRSDIAEKTSTRKTRARRRTAQQTARNKQPPLAKTSDPSPQSSPGVSPSSEGSNYEFNHTTLESVEFGHEQLEDGTSPQPPKLSTSLSTTSLANLLNTDSPVAPQSLPLRSYGNGQSVGFVQTPGQHMFYQAVPEKTSIPIQQEGLVKSPKESTATPDVLSDMISTNSSIKNFESNMANEEYVQLTDLLNTNPPSPSDDFFDFEDDKGLRPYIEINVRTGSMTSSYAKNGTPNSYVYNEKHSKMPNTARVVPEDIQEDEDYTSPLIMRHVVKAPDDIYLTNIVKAYQYPKAYHALISYLKRRFSKEQLIEIAKCMAKYRPSFISATKSLHENDLIFTERSFQRTLLEYEQLIAMSPSPTIIWRRTGEIVALTNEFAVMTGYSKMALLSKRTFIVEPMDDESTIKYFRSFSDFAFGDLNATYLTDCNLRKAEDEDYLKCCCVWTIKRDVFDIPMLIVGQFLPVLD